MPSEMIFARLLDPTPFQSLWYWLLLFLAWMRPIYRFFGIRLVELESARAGRIDLKSRVIGQMRHAPHPLVGYLIWALFGFLIVSLLRLYLVFGLAWALGVLCIITPIGLQWSLEFMVFKNFERRLGRGLGLSKGVETEELVQTLSIYRIVYQILAGLMFFFAVVLGAGVGLNAMNM